MLAAAVAHAFHGQAPGMVYSYCMRFVQDSYTEHLASPFCSAVLHEACDLKNGLIIPRLYGTERIYDTMPKADPESHMWTNAWRQKLHRRQKVHWWGTGTRVSQLKKLKVQKTVALSLTYEDLSLPVSLSRWSEHARAIAISCLQMCWKLALLSWLYLFVNKYRSTQCHSWCSFVFLMLSRVQIIIQ